MGMIKNMQEIIEQARRFGLAQLIANHEEEVTELQKEQLEILLNYYRNQGYLITNE